MEMSLSLSLSFLLLTLYDTHELNLTLLNILWMLGQVDGGSAVAE